MPHVFAGIGPGLVPGGCRNSLQTWKHTVTNYNNLNNNQIWYNYSLRKSSGFFTESFVQSLYQKLKISKSA